MCYSDRQITCEGCIERMQFECVVRAYRFGKSKYQRQQHEAMSQAVCNEINFSLAITNHLQQKAVVH